MDWPTRVRVALGVARALAYIHHCCEPRIVHRDVSSTNVLLDENFEPRLSDFGLAKLLFFDDTHVTVTVAGTFGYVSPGMALSITLLTKILQAWINDCICAYSYMAVESYGK